MVYKIVIFAFKDSLARKRDTLGTQKKYQQIVGIQPGVKSTGLFYRQQV